MTLWRGRPFRDYFADGLRRRLNHESVILLDRFLKSLLYLDTVNIAFYLDAV